MLAHERQDDLDMTKKMVEQIADSRQHTLQAICEELETFSGNFIDMYIMAPGRGNLGSLFNKLRERNPRPLKAKWRITLYSGRYNMSSMTEADIAVIRERAAQSDIPLIDIGKHPFFGGDEVKVPRPRSWTQGNQKLGTKMENPTVTKLSVAGVPFDTCKFLKDGTELHARNTSYLKVFGMSISAAVLYMPSQATLAAGGDVTNPKVPKALEVHYMKGLSADQLRWVTSDSIAGNGFAVDTGVQEFNSLYQDVACGDSYCLMYNTPDGAVEGSVTLSKNGVALGSVFGNKVSEAIYSVWFGDYVWFKQMRDDLLGMNGGPY